MASLNLTPKQERFCQLYIELGNASEAYRQSYDADSMNENTVHVKASELLSNGKVAVRVEQLKKSHQTRHNLTVDDLLAELEEARKMALDLNIQEKPQVGAAVTATMGKAKLLGLDKQLVDITTNGESINKPTTIELVAPHVESTNTDTA